MRKLLSRHDIVVAYMNPQHLYSMHKICANPSQTETKLGLWEVGIGSLVTVSTSSHKGSNALFWPLQILHACGSLNT